MVNRPPQLPDVDVVEIASPSGLQETLSAVVREQRDAAWPAMVAAVGAFAKDAKFVKSATSLKYGAKCQALRQSLVAPDAKIDRNQLQVLIDKTFGATVEADAK